MADEVELTLWCAKCAAQKAVVYRRPTGGVGVYHHETEPKSMTGVSACPDCGNPLERR